MCLNKVRFLTIILTGILLPASLSYSMGNQEKCQGDNGNPEVILDESEADSDTELQIHMHAFTRAEENSMRRATKAGGRVSRRAVVVPSMARQSYYGSNRAPVAQRPERVDELREQYRERMGSVGGPVVVTGDGDTIWFSEDGFNFTAYNNDDITSPVSVFGNQVHLWFKTRYERDLLRMQPINVSAAANQANEDNANDEVDTEEDDDIYS